MENLQRLRVLQAVAQHGSFTAAGSALSMSQPAVSQQVSALEREMGARLVERSTLGARLTPEGEVVLRHAHRMLASQTDARRELDRLRSGDLAPVAVRPLRPTPPPRRRWVMVAPGESAEPVAHLVDCLLATASRT